MCLRNEGGEEERRMKTPLVHLWGCPCVLAQVGARLQRAWAVLCKRGLCSRTQPDDPQSPHLPTTLIRGTLVLLCSTVSCSNEQLNVVVLFAKPHLDHFIRLPSSLLAPSFNPLQSSSQNDPYKIQHIMSLSQSKLFIDLPSQLEWSIKFLPRLIWSDLITSITQFSTIFPPFLGAFTFL